MSLKNKLQNWFYLDEDEQEEAKQQPSEQQSVKEKRRPISEQQKPRNQKNRKQNNRKLDLVEEEQSSPRIVSLPNAQKQAAKVVLVEPRVYAEAQDISEHLKNKRAVVINLQRIDREQGIRIIDFLSGTVYALGGDIQRIGKDIFLCTPDNVEVDGAISDYFEQ